MYVEQLDGYVWKPLLQIGFVKTFFCSCQRVFTEISEFSMLFIIVRNLELLIVPIKPELLGKSTALYIRSTSHSLFTPHSF